MEKINLAQKFSLFNEYWSPCIAGELNETHVKLVKLKGEFIWHHHEAEDELFWVIKGRLLIKFRDRDLWLDEGVEHMPVAEEEVHVVLIEPKTTVNTGNVQNERTAAEQWI